MMGHGGRGKGGMVPEKKAPMHKALGQITSYSKKRMVYIIIALVLAVAGAILTIFGPGQLSKITDYVTQGLTSTIDLGKIAQIGVVLIVIYLLSALFTYLQHFIMTTVTLKQSNELRGEIYAKINRVPLKYFNTTSHGDVLSRMTNDVDSLGQALSNSLPTIVSSVAQFVSCLIMMFVTEWRMALAALGTTMIGFVLMALIMSRSQKFFIAQQLNLGNMNGYIEEIYSGQDVIRISRANNKVKDRFAKLNYSVFDANRKANFFSSVMQPLMNLVGNLGYVAVCILGAYLAMSGKITFGIIVAFIMYVRLFTSPLASIAQGMTNIQTAAAAGDRVFSFLGEEEMENEDDKTPHLATAKGKVEFKHVQFSYPDKPEKLIIKDFSALVKPGEKVAIVGPTGAGKTTMVNLLMRFYEINSGEILIDGVPISQMTRAEVHNMFSMVLQDTWLFEGTVRENLVFNKQNVTEEQLIAACKACGIYGFIKTLPKGFDSTLSGSTAISAGQKQLFTIARAMIQDSSMLILDEATSSVDTRTEVITQKAMDQLMQGRTSFVIAHRLSTIKNADMILVMVEGDIIEQGNHEELLAQNGFYADLYRSQFQKVS